MIEGRTIPALDERESDAELAYMNAREQSHTLRILCDVADPAVVRTVWLMAYIKGRMDGVDSAIALRQR